jgi:hypothetical protein
MPHLSASHNGANISIVSIISTQHHYYIRFVLRYVDGQQHALELRRLIFLEF